MPQLSYSQNAIPGQPGMAFDNELSSRDVVTAIAAVNIPFGVYCELNATGQAVPMQDSGTTTTFLPLKLGISLFDPLGVEQAYTTWTVPATLAGTVSVANGNAGITFSTNQTLAQGTAIVFSSQPGVEYFLAQAVSSSTLATLTVNYGGTTNGAATTTTPGNGSTASGWLKGMAVPFMRKGRIWVATDASGSQVQTGAINVWHSSDGTHAQGVFTFLAASAVGGAEIDVAPGCLAWNVGKQYSAQYTDPWGNVFSTTPVEINI